MKRLFYFLTLVGLAMLLVACGGEEDVVPTEAATAEAVPEATAVPESGTTDETEQSGGETITDIVWQWTAFQDTADVNNISVPNPDQYTLILRTDGRAQIQADCNQVQWTYTQEGNSLTFNTLGPSTLAFCGEASLDQEYLQKLGATGTFVMNNGQLVLNLMADAGNMIFDNGGPAPDLEVGNLPEEPFCDVVDPTWLHINTFGLPYSWQASCVEATPYDESQPPGPMGLPEHIEVNFVTTDPNAEPATQPIIYIIPANSYAAMWSVNGNDSVADSLDRLTAILAEQPEPFPSSGVPALPTEEVTGVRDLTVQGAYLDFSSWGGLRYVARFAQDANPVTNQGLRYIFQGYAGEDDGIFVAMFWPVRTSALPDDASTISQEEWDSVTNNNEAYMADRTAYLDALAPTDWEPPLTILDALLASIDYSDPQTPGPVPTVEVPTPEPDTPYGVVTAPGGVNVRTGPGSVYPVIGTAAFGTEGPIIGVSADGQWWVTPVVGAPNNQGWVSAAYVQAFNVDNVPVIPPPPPPVPTATPTALPTPAPSVDFWADRTTINEGECTTLRWDVENIQAVWVYPQGEDYAKYPTTGQGSQQVCPTTTTTYEMRVQMIDGSVQFEQITINVNENSPLVNTSWSVATLNVTATPIPGTSLTIFFGTNSHTSGNSGCNSFSGTYFTSGNNISINLNTSSQALCSDEINGQETLYRSLLQAAVSYELSGNQLVLRNVNGQEILRYNRIN